MHDLHTDALVAGLVTITQLHVCWRTFASAATVSAMQNLRRGGLALCPCIWLQPKRTACQYGIQLKSVSIVGIGALSAFVGLLSRLMCWPYGYCTLGILTAQVKGSCCRLLALLTSCLCPTGFGVHILTA